MAIEYMLDFHCPPKEDLSVEGLQSLLKAESQSREIVRALRETGDLRDPSEIEIDIVRTTPEGSRPGKVSLRDLLAAGEELAKHAPHCNTCPANAQQRPFGCYGAITYPIQRETEEWLLSLLPDALGSTAGVYLTSAIEDFEYDGAPVAALRQRGGTFFESDESEAVGWNDAESTVVSADQLLQMMFFVGPLQAPHCLMLSLFCGILPHDLDPERISEAMQDAELMRNLFAHARIPDGPRTPQIQAFRGFLAALTHAATLGEQLLIDA
jgi:hypothetical protein